LAAIIEKFHHHQERWTSLYKLWYLILIIIRFVESKWFSSEKQIKKAKKLNSWLLVMNILLTKLVP
jgi:hypothetical protein